MRKTAAICVAKLYDINPEMVEDRGFLDILQVQAVVPAQEAITLEQRAFSLHSLNISRYVVC